MKKKSLIRRIKQKINRRIQNWKHRNTIWCYDETECTKCSDPECYYNKEKEGD